MQGACRKISYMWWLHKLSLRLVHCGALKQSNTANPFSGVLYRKKQDSMVIDWGEAMAQRSPKLKQICEEAQWFGLAALRFTASFFGKSTSLIKKWTCSFCICLFTDKSLKKKHQNHGLLGEGNKFCLAKLWVSISKSKAQQSSVKNTLGCFYCPGRRTWVRYCSRLITWCMVHNADPFGCACLCVVMQGGGVDCEKRCQER